MAFPMVKLRRSKSGAFAVRKGIPEDVRDEYQRLYGQRWEVQFYSEAGRPLSDAKARFNDWLAEHEGRIEAIRAGQKGEGQPPTQRQAHGLAGEWYLWFVGRHEEEPGDPMGWWWRQVGVEDDLEDLAPLSFREDPSSDPRLSWLAEPSVRPKARAIIADGAETAQFLASKGLTLNHEARDLFWTACSRSCLQPFGSLNAAPKAISALTLARNGFPSSPRIPPGSPQAAPVGTCSTHG